YTHPECCRLRMAGVSRRLTAADGIALWVAVVTIAVVGDDTGAQILITAGKAGFAVTKTVPVPILIQHHLYAFIHGAVTIVIDLVADFRRIGVHRAALIVAILACNHDARIVDVLGPVITETIAIDIAESVGGVVAIFIMAVG